MFTDLSSETFRRSKEAAWSACYANGLWRYFDPSVDQWALEDGTPNSELCSTLKVCTLL